jgi:PAS domain S-box-containing protein
MYGSLTPVAGGLALLYLIFSLAHPLLLFGAARSVMTALSLLTMAAFTTLWILLRRTLVPREWSHEVGGAIAIFVLVNSLAHLHFVPLLYNTTNLALLIIGVGILFYSYAWLLALMAASWAGWLIVTWGARASPEWSHYGFLLVAATVLCLIVYTVRMRLLRNVEDLQLAVQEASHRVKTERNLRLTEARYHRVLETAQEGVWILDPGGRISYANQRLAEILGYDREELEGRLLVDLVDGSQREEVEQRLGKRVRRGRSGWELKMLRKDGEKLWLSVATSPIRHSAGRFVGSLGMSFNITGRKKVEKKLRESEAKFRTLAEQSPNMIFIYCKGRVVYANAMCEEMMGYSREDVYASDFHFMQLIAPESVDLVQESFEKHMRGEEVAPYEYILLKKDGSRVDAVITTRLIDYEGETAILGVVTDITELKQMEQRLRGSQKMEAIALLTSGFAHHFNNLLTVIQGYASASFERLPEDSALLSPIEAINDAVARASALTHQLLAYSRLQALQPERLVLNEFVAQLEDSVRKKLHEDVQYSTLLTESKTVIQVDPNQLEQVVLHLVANARDAMPDGGTLIVETDQVNVTETPPGTTVPEGTYVRLSVQDTGCGMDEETLEHVFEPFFTTKEGEDRAGLGLATVYGIVKQSGGFVYLDSKKDEGTRVEILFPLVEDALEQEEAAS